LGKGIEDRTVFRKAQGRKFLDMTDDRFNDVTPLYTGKYERSMPRTTPL
jgi:hypothetical protein